MITQDLFDRLFCVPLALIIALAFHEFAHAFVADRLGDPVPRQQGRLTLDIRKHIDPLGALMLLLFQFGWGRPVETDPRYFKNPKLGMAAVSAAGPIMNILIALVFAILLNKLNVTAKFGVLLFRIFSINAGLAVFNLIPIPPLDGSKIISIFLTQKAYYNYMIFQAKYNAFLLIGLLIIASTTFFSAPLYGFIEFLYKIGAIIAYYLPF